MAARNQRSGHRKSVGVICEESTGGYGKVCASQKEKKCEPPPVDDTGDFESDKKAEENVVKGERKSGPVGVQNAGEDNAKSNTQCEKKVREETGGRWRPKQKAFLCVCEDQDQNKAVSRPTKR
jgi:hypothetical protein